MGRRSGTVHELNQAIDACKAQGQPIIMVYFKDEPVHPAKVDTSQLTQLQDLKKEIRGECLYGTYSDTKEFEKLVRGHLTKIISEYRWIYDNTDQLSNKTLDTNITLNMSGSPVNKKQQEESFPRNSTISIWRYIVILSIVVLAFFLGVGGQVLYKSYFSSNGLCDSEEFNNLCADAKKTGNQFVFQSITVIARIRDIQEEQDGQYIKHRQLFLRVIYCIRPLVNLDRNEVLFEERFRNTGKEITHFYGNCEDTFLEGSTGTLNYKVKFGASCGDTFTVVTGANYLYDLPLAKGRVFSEDIVMDEKIDNLWWLFDKNEHIAEYNLIIESENVDIKPMKRGAVRRYQDKNYKRDQVVITPATETFTGTRTLSYRWTNIRPGEGCGIFYTW